MQLHSAYKYAETSELNFFHGHACFRQTCDLKRFRQTRDLNKSGPNLTKGYPQTYILRERERDRDRDRDRQTDRHRERDRETERETERHRDRDRETERERERERETERERDRERDRERQREKLRERETQRETHTHRDRERENSNSKPLYYKDCSLGSVKKNNNKNCLTTSPC